MCFVEGETGLCSETYLTRDVDGTEEVSIKVEDAMDIKEEISIKVEDAIDIEDEILEAVTFSPIKTEREVRLNLLFLPVCYIVGGIHLLKVVLQF
jgi:hypothetical protein